jgi:hypothetical protein
MPKSEWSSPLTTYLSFSSKSKSMGLIPAYAKLQLPAFWPHLDPLQLAHRISLVQGGHRHLQRPIRANHSSLPCSATRTHSNQEAVAVLRTRGNTGNIPCLLTLSGHSFTSGLVTPEMFYAATAAAGSIEPESRWRGVTVLRPTNTARIRVSLL